MNWKIAAITSSVVGVVGIGVSVGVTVPLLLKSKDAIENYVPRSATSKLIDSSAINYVALGDSVTAGYSALMNGDYLSYADFFAKDLQKANRLGSYKNFAVSGAKISDQRDLFTKDVYAIDSIKNADIITTTIGANDLLAFVTMTDLPYFTSINSIEGIVKGTVTKLNVYRNTAFSSNTNVGTTDETTYSIIDEAIDKLEKMLETRDFHELLGVQKDARDIIFDIIKRDLYVFTHDLHEVAPNAKLVFIGPAMPFRHFPAHLLNSKQEAFGNITIMEYYNQFLETLRIGSTTDPIDGDSPLGYAEFYKFDDAPKFVEEIDLTMANPIDIHPSTYGHQIMGNWLFKSLAPKMKIDNPESFYTLGTAPNGDKVIDAANFELYDQEPAVLQSNIFIPLFKQLFDEMESINSNGKLPAWLEKMLPAFDDLKDLLDVVANYWRGPNTQTSDEAIENFANSIVKNTVMYLKNNGTDYFKSKSESEIKAAFLNLSVKTASGTSVRIQDQINASIQSAKAQNSILPLLMGFGVGIMNPMMFIASNSLDFLSHFAANVIDEQLNSSVSLDIKEANLASVRDLVNGSTSMLGLSLGEGLDSIMSILYEQFFRVDDSPTNAVTELWWATPFDVAKLQQSGTSVFEQELYKSFEKIAKEKLKSWNLDKNYFDFRYNFDNKKNEVKDMHSDYTEGDALTTLSAYIRIFLAMAGTKQIEITI